MKDDGDLRREIEALRERLSRLSEASLRINESLDLDSVLQGVLDSARHTDRRQVCPDHHPGRVGPGGGIPRLRPDPR